MNKRISWKFKFICRICALVESRLSTKDILDRTPLHYGETINYDHLNYLFDRTFDKLEKHSVPSLILIYLIWWFKPAQRKEGSL